uniref:Uncharacterized protein n=1 Tax=Arthrobotrys musiformis TaxID=47236 RepID=A0A482EAK1_9PEZI|nr:hypothetical protein [Arthrobotrys musiformis]QBM31519.1 hypothetical protein [Arthrobotrys musiformis]QBM31670.1 hypothetical protein [Arthrobotrys musiformis]
MLSSIIILFISLCNLFNSSTDSLIFSSVLTELIACCTTTFLSSLAHSLSAETSSVCFIILFIISLYSFFASFNLLESYGPLICFSIIYLSLRSFLKYGSSIKSIWRSLPFSRSGIFSSSDSSSLVPPILTSGTLGWLDSDSLFGKLSLSEFASE